MKNQEITMIKKVIKKEYHMNNIIIKMLEDGYTKYSYTLQNDLLITILHQLSNKDYTDTILDLKSYVDRLYMLKLNIEHIIEKAFNERDYKILLEYSEYAKVYRSIINGIEYDIDN